MTYTRGVLITSFPGLIHYQGQAFMLYDQLMPWDTLIKLPMKAIMVAFSDRALYHARRH